MNPTDPDGQVLNIDFYPRRRVNCVGPRVLLAQPGRRYETGAILGEAS